MAVKENPNAMNALEQAASRGVLEAGNIVKEEAVRLVMQTSKTGRTYTRRGVTHQASAPGQPYASDTGSTVAQIDDPVLRDPLTAAIVFRGENARRLELGTENMEPRPVARPALQNTRDDAQAAIMTELAKAVS